MITALARRPAGQIRVVRTRLRRCLTCDGDLTSRRVQYARRETAEDAGFSVDAAVPYCDRCDVAFIPAAIVAIAQMASGWKTRAGEEDRPFQPLPDTSRPHPA